MKFSKSPGIQTPPVAYLMFASQTAWPSSWTKFQEVVQQALDRMPPKRLGLEPLYIAFAQNPSNAMWAFLNPHIRAHRISIENYESFLVWLEIARAKKSKSTSSLATTDDLDLSHEDCSDA